MDESNYKYFIATRKILSSGKEYKIEYAAETESEFQDLETNHIETLNKPYKEYETIKIEGPFNEPRKDFLIFFRNKEVKSFIDTTERKITGLVEKLKEGGEEILGYEEPIKSEDIAFNLTEESKKVAAQVKADSERVCDEILNQAIEFNKTILKDKKGLGMESINKIFVDCFEYSKSVEIEMHIFIQKAAAKVKQQAESALQLVSLNEYKWNEKILKEGSIGLKKVLIERELERRRAALELKESIRIAAHKLEEAGEQAIKNIQSELQRAITSELERKKRES